MPKVTTIPWQEIHDLLEDGQWHTILTDVPHSTYMALRNNKIRLVRHDYEFASTNTVRQPDKVNGRKCDVMARKKPDAQG